nr:8175_t:CDS:2 [Entrophospora candida]
MDVYSVIVNLGQENRRGTNPKTWYDKGLSVDRNEFAFGTVRAEVKELIEIILLDIPKKKRNARDEFNKLFSNRLPKKKTVNDLMGKPYSVYINIPNSNFY